MRREISHFNDPGPPLMSKDGPGSLGCLSLTQLEFCFHKHYVTAGKDQHICGLDGVTAGGFTPVFPFRCLDA